MDISTNSTITVGPIKGPSLHQFDAPMAVFFSTYGGENSKYHGLWRLPSQVTI